MEDTTDSTRPDEGETEAVNLLYTVAFDLPDSADMRHMVKMLGGSVARTGFTGDMVIFRNTPHPVFQIGRQGIQEEMVDLPQLTRRQFAEYARAWKAQAAAVFEAESYDWVVYLDADCLCLRNIDHLLEDRDCDILYQPVAGKSPRDDAFNAYLTDAEMNPSPSARDAAAEVYTGPGNSPAPAALPRWGISSGTWAVRGECFRQVMEEWVLIQACDPARETRFREQGAWNRLLFDAARHGWRAEPFEAHEIQFPLGGDKDWKLHKDAAIVHGTGGTPAEKLQLMFGLYLQRFYYDPACTLLNVLEM